MLQAAEALEAADDLRILSGGEGDGEAKAEAGGYGVLDEGSQKARMFVYTRVERWKPPL